MRRACAARLGPGRLPAGGLLRGLAALAGVEARAPRLPSPLKFELSLSAPAEQATIAHVLETLLPGDFGEDLYLMWFTCGPFCFFNLLESVTGFADEAERAVHDAGMHELIFNEMMRARAGVQSDGGAFACHAELARVTPTADGGHVLMRIFTRCLTDNRAMHPEFTIGFSGAALERRGDALRLARPVRLVDIGLPLYTATPEMDR